MVRGSGSRGSGSGCRRGGQGTPLVFLEDGFRSPEVEDPAVSAEDDGDEVGLARQPAHGRGGDRLAVGAGVAGCLATAARAAAVVRIDGVLQPHRALVGFGVSSPSRLPMGSVHSVACPDLASGSTAGSIPVRSSGSVSVFGCGWRCRVLWGGGIPSVSGSASGVRRFCLPGSVSWSCLTPSPRAASVHRHGQGSWPRSWCSRRLGVPYLGSVQGQVQGRGRMGVAVSSMMPAPVPFNSTSRGMVTATWGGLPPRTGAVVAAPRRPRVSGNASPRRCSMGRVSGSPPFLGSANGSMILRSSSISHAGSVIRTDSDCGIPFGTYRRDRFCSALRSFFSSSSPSSRSASSGAIRSSRDVPSRGQLLRSGPGGRLDQQLFGLMPFVGTDVFRKRLDRLGDLLGLLHRHRTRGQRLTGEPGVLVQVAGQPDGLGTPLGCRAAGRSAGRRWRWGSR